MSIYSKGRVEDGILKARLSSFRELFEFGQFFHQSPSQYYFRGQSNEHWKLTTTLERFESELNDQVGGTRDLILKNFKRLIRGEGLLSQINISSDEEFFSLGQHYGLPTPLLDWSESFYIALFFAFSEEIPEGVENVAIWAIQTAASEVMEKFNKHAESFLREKYNENNALEMKFVDPYTDVNSRLISQSGIFLQKPNNVFIEDLIPIFCKGNSDSPLLAKITIPAREREDVLNNLFAMNINWSTIFPGIEGAARHAKMKIQMLDLKVRRMGRDGVERHVQKDIFNSP
ncbi:FRG domain-containing protein [Pectobacterium sp. CHL-2024]|uniref:FRG domain-containing protein n=1 Tax=Pectobacterium sp. CHL-2024 TaxID=3377079 RepID=UPI00382C0C5E